VLGVGVDFVKIYSGQPNTKKVITYYIKNGKIAIKIKYMKKEKEK